MARFLSLADVATELSVSVAQARTLVRTGELPAIQVGGRGIWRVEAVELENYIQRQYARSRTLRDDIHHSSSEGAASPA